MQSRWSRRPLTRLILALLALTATEACMRQHAATKALCGRASVLLLTIDSLRPDHLSTYGYGRDTSPELTALARDSVVFRNAFAAASWTSPALVSLFSAHFPFGHGVIARDRIAAPQLSTPLKAVRAAGYRVPDLFHFQGIPDYRNLGFEPMAGAKADSAALLRWIESAQAELFLVAYHLRKVHLPYNPPPPYDAYFAAQVAQSGGSALSGGVEAVRSRVRVFKGSVAFDSGDRPLVVALYDGAVRAQDEELGLILHRLQALGRYDDLLIVVTADHGEELFDHGFVGHPSTSLDGTLYDEVLRIPLVIKFPGERFAGHVIDTPVRSVDVLPTVLDALGIAPASDSDGHSLLPLIRGRAGRPPGPILAETSVCGYACPADAQPRYLRAVRDERYKLIEEADGGRVMYRLFDVLQDPGEQKDIADRNADLVERLRLLLPVPESPARRPSG